jgi:hypothetical protein
MNKNRHALLLITAALCFRCGNTPTESVSAPVITAQPEAQIVMAGNAVSFSVIAAGNPEPAYQWLMNGDPLSGKTEAKCTISAAAFSDTGTYAVMVSNSPGTVTSDPARLTVYTLSVLPLSDTVVADSGFTFAANVSGLPAPTYQWRLDGFDLPGAKNATYTKTSATIDDAGTYSVIVSSSAGIVFSHPVQLTVTP